MIGTSCRTNNNTHRSFSFQYPFQNDFFRILVCNLNLSKRSRKQLSIQSDTYLPSFRKNLRFIWYSLSESESKHIGVDLVDIWENKSTNI